MELFPNWPASREDYPRKQFRRDRWISLNGKWQFRFDNDEQFESPSQIKDWPLEIQVPFVPECLASGIADTEFHNRVWYRKEIQLQKSSKRMLLHFGAVDYEAHVWLNEKYLGKHTGGNTPFVFDITHFLEEGTKQVLYVRADDDPLDLAKPRGKQDWQRKPHSIWYMRSTGIWQTVWLEEVPETYIKHLAWKPLIDRWEIGCEAKIDGAKREGLQMNVRLSVDGRLLAYDRYQVIHQEIHRKISLSDPGIDDFRNELLWSPEKPTLIQAEVELWDQRELLDRIESYTALRSISLQRDRFMLNGRPYTMRLVLDQGYWPDTLMTAPDSQALKKDIELIKSAGFNGVRMHQKIEDPDFLYWADVMGLLVWAEMPSAYRFTHESVERLIEEWMEVIDRDMNHPCVAVWVPFNESWGVPDLAAQTAHQNCVQALYHLTKTLDPTRPVIGNDGWESVATDLLGIHDYDADPDRLLKKYSATGSLRDILQNRRPGGRILTVDGYPHNGQPILLTEFGGIACTDSKTEDWGYSVCKTPEEFRSRYEKLMNAVHSIEIFCGFCYTQFTDTFQEANGLFTMDRKPKFPLSAIARATRGTSSPRGELISVPQPPPLHPDH